MENVNHAPFVKHASQHVKHAFVEYAGQACDMARMPKRTPILLDSIGKRIAYARKARGHTQPWLAEQCGGISRSAVWQWETDKTTPTGPNMYDIEVALGINAKWLVKGEGPMENPQRGDVVYVPMDRKIPIVGEVAAGVWLEAGGHEQNQEEFILLPDSINLKMDGIFALRVRGESMNILYKDGEIILCEHFNPMVQMPPVGKRVIVHRRSKHGTYEATVKELRRDNAGVYWLWPRSDNPAFQQPIKYEPQGDGDNDIEIVGIVRKHIGDD